MTTFTTAGVIGAGAWGTALAQVCARAGLAVTLWAKEPEVAADIAATRMNSAFLPGVALDPAIDVTTELSDLAPWDIILAVAPAQHLRSTLEAFAVKRSAVEAIGEVADRPHSGDRNAKLRN